MQWPALLHQQTAALLFNVVSKVIGQGEKIFTVSFSEDRQECHLLRGEKTLLSEILRFLK